MAHPVYEKTTTSHTMHGNCSPLILTNDFAVGLLHEHFVLQKTAENRFIRSCVVNGKGANVAANSTPKVRL